MVTKMIGVKEFRQNMARCCRLAKKHNWQYLVLNRNTPIFLVRALSDKESKAVRLQIKNKEIGFAMLP